MTDRRSDCQCSDGLAYVTVYTRDVDGEEEDADAEEEDGSEEVFGKRTRNSQKSSMSKKPRNGGA